MLFFKKRDADLHAFKIGSTYFLDGWMIFNQFSRDVNFLGETDSAIYYLNLKEHN